MEAFYRNILRDLYRNSTISLNGKDCKEWNGACTESGYGRKRVTWPDGKKSMERTHRLIYMAQHKIHYSELKNKNEFGEQLDVSHLCNNKKCIEVDHLVHEPHSINMDRNECFKHGHCSKVHSPHCII